jgi:uncharacterized protein YutE (UPF0331/DUF86 family)
MAPPNQTLIFEKLDTIARCIERVRAKTPQSLEQLTADVDRQDIIVINLERAMKASIDIASHIIAYTALPVPVTMADAFEKLADAKVISAQTAQRMKKAVGLRNILVHEYTRLDWNILWQVITNHLDDIRKYATEVRDQTRPDHA